MVRKRGLKRTLIYVDEFLKKLQKRCLEEAPYGVCEPESPQYKTFRECIELLGQHPKVEEEEIIKSFIEWFLNQNYCAVDANRNCLLVGRNGKYVNALKVYREEKNK